MGFDGVQLGAGCGSFLRVGGKNDGSSMRDGKLDKMHDEAGRGGSAAGSAEAALARQQIMELRHAYAVATDLIGTNVAANVERGRAIYHQIFAPGALIGAAGIEPVTGPDAWVQVVLRALEPYSATQHLIGTQYVSDLQLPDYEGAGGSAHLTSYLQAWHSMPDDRVWLYMGTYEDDLTFSAGHRWQITRMMLHAVAADYRKVGRRPPG